jgi:enoyl-CoA hydratase/carnithine racemase
MLDQKNYESILIEKHDDGVAVATLNRPDRLNAVGGTMHPEIERLPGDVDGDPSVRCLVITGAGRAFCAGGDFSANPGHRGAPEYVVPMHGPRTLVDNWLDSEKPIIAAVNGYALGLGATVAFLSDIVIAARSAKFGDTHVRMAMGAGDGGQVLWPMLIGTGRAKYFLITGEHVTGEDAYRMGLASIFTEDADLMPRAMELAHKLAAGPTFALAASKVPTNKLLKFVSNLVLPLSLAMEAQSMAHPDHLEAVKAFQEKREPRYQR